MQGVTRLSTAVDLEELRRPVLHGLCVVTLAVSWAWLALYAGGTLYYPPSISTILPAGIILITSAICLLFSWVGSCWRSTVLLIGLGSTLLLGHRWMPSPAWIYYSALLVMMAGVLLRPGFPFIIAAILTGTHLSCFFSIHSPYPLDELWPALGLLWANAVASWLSARSLYTALAWAMDSQARAWHTVDEVRLRRAQLKRTLDSLQTTYALLERTTHELESARAEAEDARVLKSRFVANISHELRTPLNIIVGFAELLCLSPESYGNFSWPTALREDLLTIWRNAQHLLGMIHDVLDLAQIEATHLPVVPEPTDTAQLIRDTLVAASALIRDSKLTLQVSLPSGLPTLNIDRTRIRQVLLNLINNAVHFTTEGCIEVGARSEADEITIYVRDSGEGIPEDKLETIFREFEQAAPSSGQPGQGAGLGLAISRHLIRLHGGRIWAESTVGMGSTFYFSLPISDGSAAKQAGELRRTESRKSSRREDQGSIAVLCPDPLVRQMLERHLDQMHVLAAEGPAQVVSLIRDQHPDAAVIAAEAPGSLEEATAVARRILQAVAPIDLPVVVCTFPTERRAGIALGVREFLIKPVMRNDVVSAVRRLRQNVRRVLIVDDETDMLRLLASIVRQEWPEADVLTASSGNEAMRLLPRQPDVVLLDLIMPDTSGVDVLKAIRSNPQMVGTAVVVITARAPAEDLAEVCQGELRLLKGNGFAAAELMHVLAALTKSVPPRYVGSSAAPPDTLAVAVA